MTKQIKSLNASQVAVLRERATYPEKLPSPRVFNDPVKLLIQLERPVYEYLRKVSGETNFTDTVEDTIETLVRVLANDGLDLEFIQSTSLPENPPSIEWPKPEISLSDDDGEIPF